MADQTSTPHLTESLEYCVRHRHSIRFYTEDPVDEAILRECVALAQLAPSNSNIQNWRLTLASGDARKRVVAAMKEAASQGEPKIPPLPETFRHYRSELGAQLYGPDGYGIGREEKERALAATLRNFEFFGAPVVGVLTMDHVLEPVDALSVGMFVQTFMLALTERQLGTCLEGSVTGYPEVLRKEFSLPDDQDILCGIAIGYPAKHCKVNELQSTRDDIDSQVHFITL
jgi:nitroreductase